MSSRNTWALSAAAIVSVISFFNRDYLPTDIDLVSGAGQPPLQKKIREESEVRSFQGVSYEIRPRFSYELTGVVVSFRYHDGNSRLHQLANDHLNMMDVCVVWGDTARSPLLSKIKIWNGVFTCNLNTRDQAAWNSISMEEVSNNHLISDDPAIRDAAQGLRVGDQIRIRGQLADYAAGGGQFRRSSVTRTDQGNGACETILLDSFEVLQRGFSMWRLTFYVSLAIAALCLLLHFASPHKARDL